MILGIDCSRYANPKPTGVELYTDRIVDGLIKHADQLGYQEVRLYVKTAEQVEKLLALVEESQQSTIHIRVIERKRLWTIVWLSWEMFRYPIDVLFIPSHTLPLILPKRNILTVHALESFLFPMAYTFFQRWHHWFSLWWATYRGAQFIAVSNTTKKDLQRFFALSENRITVIWNGYDHISRETEKKSSKAPLVEGDFILSIGRLEERKNQKRLIEAFETIADAFSGLKLVLVGSDGFGAEGIHKKVEESRVKDYMVITGYQDREVVQLLLSGAKVFAFPSLAEGFGIPILEAFDAGVPVLTSKGGATEEVGGEAAIYCDPLSVESIAEGLKALLTDAKMRNEKIEAGKKRIEMFSWGHCREETAKVMKKFTEDVPKNRS